jgi:hypothetical protein
MTWEEPYIVLGTGRSGTSFVSSVLHEQLGVDMGKSIDKDKTNPEGFYEDRDFLALNQLILTGKIDVDQWTAGFDETVARRVAANKPWGIKDPRFCLTWPLASKSFKWSRLIICERDSRGTVQSMVRCYKVTPMQAMLVFNRRMDGINRLLKGKDPLVLDLGKRRSIGFVADMILEKFPELVEVQV